MEDSILERLRRKTLLLPMEPGVYLMKDVKGTIIYVGKAKLLKNRVSSYFRSIDKHLPKVRKMVEHVHDFDYIVCDSEYEALVLECSLIKLHQPHYNILLKDDKGYHYIRITPGPYSRISAEHQKTDPDSTYLGPYMSSMVAEDTVEEAVKAFCLPTCRKKFPEDFRKGRPCLNYHIKQCMGVCTGRISEQAYAEIMGDVMEFLKNGTMKSEADLKAQMEQAAEELDFERAARLRDRMRAVQRLNGPQKVFAFSHQSLDAVAAVQGGDKLYFAFLIFREGRLRDKKSFAVDFFESADEQMEELLLSCYQRAEEIPQEIFLDRELPGRELLERALTQRAGRKVQISVPQRGQGFQLMDMARNNAAQELARQTSRTGRELSAVDELGRMLGLPASPGYIEAYDISNIGSDTIVGGMVVFEDGRPRRKYYKKFRIQGLDKPDDYASMGQMLTRRFEHYLDPEEKDEGFRRRPDLLLIDGGAGQVGVVRSVLAQMGLEIPVFGMVKDNRHRTRAVTAGAEEIAISASRSVFHFVTSVQDEVHRYSIEFSRSSHRKSSLEVRLKEAEGIGESRAAALYQKFRTLKAICAATEQELAQTPGMSVSAAKSLYRFLHPEGQGLEENN